MISGVFRGFMTIFLFFSFLGLMNPEEHLREVVYTFSSTFTPGRHPGYPRRIRTRTPPRALGRVLDTARHQHRNDETMDTSQPEKKNEKKFKDIL